MRAPFRHLPEPPAERVALQLVPEDADTLYPRLSRFLDRDAELQAEVARLLFNAYQHGRRRVRR